MAVFLFGVGVVTWAEFQPAPAASIARLGALEDRRADCGSILANTATVRAQQMSNRATDNDHEH
jgi:hypothetical protein